MENERVQALLSQNKSAFRDLFSFDYADSSLHIRAYAETHQAPSTMKEMMAGAIKGGQVVICSLPLPSPARFQLLIRRPVTCSDSRVIPEQFFGFSRGEYGVIRNAGGRAMDALRSVLILGGLAPGGTIIVVHHTGLGTRSMICRYIGLTTNRLRPVQFR